MASNKAERFKAELEKCASEDPAFKKLKVYRAFFQHYNTGFKKLGMPVDDFIDQISAGTFFKSPRGN